MTPKPRNHRPTASDRALVRAIRAWEGGDLNAWLPRFAPAWAERLGECRAEAVGESADRAWAMLRDDHARSIHPDPSRVHPTWFVRALRAESPAVRLAVAKNLDGPTGETVRRAIEFEPAGDAKTRTADPEVLELAKALWSERLVGDVPTSIDDPPVILALTRVSHRDLARLVKVCGIVKHAFAVESAGPTEDVETIARFTPLDRVRFAYFRRQIGRADPRLRPAARLDLRAIAGDRRRAHARTGLLTLGRLLASVEPHRGRWAVQHLPYAIAKLLRPKEEPPLPAEPLLTWEAWVLEAAWARLFSEGRLASGLTSASETPTGELP